MLIRELIEGVTQIFGKSGGKVVRKYRCTSGSRKGRIVAKPSTCTAPKKMSASTAMKKTRRARSSQQAIRTSRTKKYNVASKRVAKINRSRTPSRRKGRGKKI